MSNIHNRSDLVAMAKRVSENIGVGYPVVLEAYKLYWESIKNSINEAELSDCERGGLKEASNISFNIKRLGKLHTNYNRVLAINNKINESTKYKKSNTNA